MLHKRMMHYENNFQGVFLPNAQTMRTKKENKEGKSPVMLRVFFYQEMADFDSMKILWTSHCGTTLPADLEVGRQKPCLSMPHWTPFPLHWNGVYYKFEDDDFLIEKTDTCVYVQAGRYVAVFDAGGPYRTCVLPLIAASCSFCRLVSHAVRSRRLYRHQEFR